MRPASHRASALLLLAIATSPGCATRPEPPVVHAFRLLPGMDLRQEIQRRCETHGIEAGWVAACVGSLTDYCLRFADRSEGTSGTGRFEIVSFTGTVSKNGSHLHLAISDGDGRTIGGHLLDGCRVYTTAEIVLCESKDHVFARELDGSTPWKELQIRYRARAASPQ